MTYNTANTNKKKAIIKAIDKLAETTINLGLEFKNLARSLEERINKKTLKEFQETARKVILKSEWLKGGFSNGK